jgi:PAS domain S-box-containing protein
MVDVAPSHAGLLAGALADAGWQVEHEHADGADALAAALQRRGWDAVLYGGDARGAVPARKALALVRLADPHLPFLAVSPFVRPGDLAAVVRGLDDAAVVVSEPAQLPRALKRELESARMGRRVGSAHHLLFAQQAITDHLAAGLEPDDLCERVLATLGATLGWSVGVVWRPAEDQALLRCASTWHAPDARPEVVAFADALRVQHYAPGQGMPGRVWAFRWPSWVPDISRDARMPRAGQALRAGLMTAVAFPVAVADDCAGVIQFFSHGIHEPNAEVSAMFAIVGGQLAQYLQRRRVEEAESERLHAALDRTRGFLDAAGALIVVLDGEGKVLLANARACTAVGMHEPELMGRDWFALTVPKAGRTAARAAFEQVMAGEVDSLTHRLPSADGQRRAIAFHATTLDDGAGVLLLGHAEVVARRAAIVAAG